MNIILAFSLFRTTPLCASSQLACMPDTDDTVEAEIQPDHIYNTIPEVRHGDSIRTTSEGQQRTTSTISGENIPAVNHDYLAIIPIIPSTFTR